MNTGFASRVQGFTLKTKTIERKCPLKKTENKIEMYYIYYI